MGAKDKSPKKRYSIFKFLVVSYLLWLVVLFFLQPLWGILWMFMPPGMLFVLMDHDSFAGNTIVTWFLITISLIVFAYVFGGSEKTVRDTLILYVFVIIGILLSLEVKSTKMMANALSDLDGECVLQRKTILESIQDVQIGFRSAAYFNGPHAIAKMGDDYFKWSYTYESFVDKIDARSKPACPK